MVLWTNDDAAFCVHPGGTRLHGAAAVRASWDMIFSQGPRLRFELLEIRIHTQGSVSIHTLYEKIAVAGDAGPAHIVMATNVYVETSAGWRMLGHHASPVPRPQTPTGAAPGTVH
jgi:ketosteroid isomerase-like protein